ncbi:MAG: hypothetical protein ACYDAG_12600 [Chloroflexota bacterium]
MLAAPMALFAILISVEYNLAALDLFRTQDAALAAADAAVDAASAGDAQMLAQQAAVLSGHTSGLRGVTVGQIQWLPGAAPGTPGAVYRVTVVADHPLLSGAVAAMAGWTVVQLSASAIGGIAGRNP